MKLIRKKNAYLFLVSFLLIVCQNLLSIQSSEQWTNAIEATLGNFVYNKVDANFFVRNQEFYDGLLEMVEIKVNQNHSKIIYTSKVGTIEEIKTTRFLSLEDDGIYAYLENTNFDQNNPESNEFTKIKTDLPLVPGQTVCTFLIGPDNQFHGFEDRIANFEPMFMDFLLAIKDNFDWVISFDGKYLVKEDRHDDMWEAYIQRGRKLSDITMQEIYFVFEDGLVSECGFLGIDNGVEVRHIYNFQFGGVEFEFPSDK